MKPFLQKTKSLTALFAIVTLLLMPGVGWGQQLAIFEFTGTSTGNNQFNSVTTQPANATFSTYTRTGVTWVATPDLFVSTSSWGTSVNLSRYHTFTITPTSGYKITLTQLSFLHSRSAAGATNWAVRSSADNYASDIQTGTSGTTGATTNITLSGSNFTEVTTALTFRIYAWGGNSTGNWRNDNVSLNGTITAAETPDIVLSDNSTQVSTANVNTGTTAHILHKSALSVTTANASLTGMTCTTDGNYAAADITNLKVRYSADATLDVADATLSTFTNPGTAGSKTFPSFTSQSISSGSTGYIFITADIASGATHNNTISLNALTTDNFTFSSGNKTGSTTVGGTQTIKDVSAPSVTAYSPTDNATGVSVSSNLVLTFSENIQKGTGNITIHKIADNTVVQTIDVQDVGVSISNNILTINPADFAYGTRYYVNIPSGVIQDMASNNYGGISNNSTWNFTTVAPSVTNVTSTNADGAYKIGDQIVVTITFNDNVVVTGSPRILLEMGATDRFANFSGGTGTSVLSFTYPAIQTGDNNLDLDYVATNSLQLNSGTINSADAIAATLALPAPGSANSIAGQKAVVIDGVLPTVNTYSPADGNTAVTVNQNLVLTFSENVKAGTSGNVAIYNSGGTTFETIPYNDARITFSTNTVTINPDGTFANSSEYYVQISNTAIADMAGNTYAGISNSTTWNFTTVCISISAFPYTQDFESASIPLCWTEELVTGTKSWQFIAGNGVSNPATAHGGTTNACLKNTSETADVTKLVMPVFDLSSLTAPILSFWHTQALWVDDQDELRVYYKTSSGDSWTILATYSGDVPTWTRRQISLPNPGTTYFIAFEGTAKYGHGVCIDDVTLGEVTGEPQNYLTNLISATGTPAYSKIDLVWDDATGNPLPDGYLIKGSTVGFSSIVNPTDGTEETDGTLVKNVGTGAESYSFTNLSPSTTYYFKVFSFTNAGSSINYKTDGEIPQTSSATSEGPCLVENFDVNAMPAGWSQTDITFTTNYAEFGANNGSLAMSSLGNANALSFTLSRTGNSTAKTLIVEVSTTSQSGGFTTVATFDHSNTTSGGTTNCTVDISAYSSNSTLYIRFRKSSSTTSPWRLDDILVNCGELTIWKGTTNTVWGTSTNWTNGTPSSGKSAIIENVTNDPILASSVECNKLTINTGGILTIGSNGALNVNGTLTNNAGNAGLVVKSDATGTGSLIHSTAGVAATVERHLVGYEDEDDNMFHFISSPVAAQSIRTEFVTSTPTVGHDFYSFDELTNMWINTKDGSGNWNSAFENNFAVGKGYLVAYPSDVTKNFTGTLNASTAVLICTNTPTKGNGWNLLGNPFPSAIDWTKVNLGDGMDNALYYYDNAAENYRYYLNPISGDATSLGSGQQYIPAMQGFMVHAKTTGTQTVTITNAARTHQGQNVYYKSTNSVPGSLSLKVTANGHEDEAFIHFNQNATTAFDGSYDAYKLNSYSDKVPMIFTKGSDGTDLAINGLPELEGTTVIPVYFKAAVNGEHMVSANLTSLPGALVYLVDEKLSTTQNLNTNPVYNFTSETGDDTNRFKLTFGSVGIDNPATTSSISVYTHGETLYISGLNAKAEISVVNLTGQVVISSRSNGSGLHSVNAASLPKGVYVVSVISNGQAISRKVVL